MKFVNLKIDKSKKQIIDMLSDNNKVNDGVRFDESNGKPFMNIREKNGRVRITCEMLGRPTRDNAFGYLVGTYFSGRITEKNGASKLSGIIITAPIYHTVILILLAFLIYKSFIVGGISLIPVFLLIFEILMFKGEFEKQGYIKRYIYRAFKKLYKS